MIPTTALLHAKSWIKNVTLYYSPDCLARHRFVAKYGWCETTGDMHPLVHVVKFDGKQKKLSRLNMS